MMEPPPGAALPIPVTLGIIAVVSLAVGIIYYLIKRSRD